MIQSGPGKTSTSFSETITGRKRQHHDMPSRASSNRAAQRIKATLQEPTHSHPYLSALQFAHSVNRDVNPGASMHLQTNKLVPAGKPGYIVGGEKNKHGEKVERVDHPGQMDVFDVLHQRDRLRAEVHPAKEGHLMGGWRDSTVPNAPVEIDLSHIYQNRTRAMNVARSRGEKAIWDNEKSQEIRL